MNLSALLGLGIAALVIVSGVLTSTPNWTIFFNIHAFLIVIGGTLAATLVSFPMSHLKKIFKVLWNRAIGRTQAPHMQVVEEVIALSQGALNNDNFLAEQLEGIKNPFLKEAIKLHLDGGISSEKIEVILRKRAEVHFVRYDDEAHLFRTIARFPPAFGLLGAVLGMVGLMSGLGSPDSFKQIGPAMAIALVSTLYGIAISNLIFVPLGENLGKFSKEDHLMRSIVIDSVKLLRDREHPLVVEEYLLSYLLTTERTQVANEQDAA